MIIRLPPLSTDELAKKTLSVNQHQQAYVKRLHEIGPEDAGKQKSPTIDRILILQREWTELIADYVLFAASERGGIEQVPFLEPKSISEDPQLYYPFADKS